MRLWLVRHPQPLVNAGICYGASDLMCDTLEVERCAEALAEALPGGLRLVYSPLRRSKDLALALVMRRPDFAAHPDQRLMEMDFGCWEGVEWSAIPKPEYDNWIANFGTYKFGGRECVNTFMSRVALAYAEFEKSASDTIWITHAGVIRVVSLIAKGRKEITRADEWPNDVLDFGQWTVLR